MDIHDLIADWVATTLGSHFHYRYLGPFHYIRCECPEYHCAIVRVENQALNIIDPIRSILDEDSYTRYYSERDDLFSIKVADPSSFELVLPLILKTHEIGKKAWNERKRNLTLK